MKCLIFLIITCLATVGADEEWKPPDTAANNLIYESCLKEIPLSDELFRKIRNYDFPDEKEAYEHIHCLVKKSGIFTDDNGYSSDRVVAQFAAWNVTTERVQNNIVSCVASSDPNDTPAKRAYLGLKCILSKKVEGFQRKGVNA